MNLNENNHHSPVSDDWDKETRKDWEEKMSEPVKFKKITEEEYKRLKSEGKLN